MKIQASALMIIALMISSTAGAATAPSPDIFQISKVFRIETGQNEAAVTIATAPPDRRMVIQTVSMHRFATTHSGDLQGFLTVSIFGTSTTYPMDAVPLPYLGNTMNTTVYAGASQPVSVSVNRFGDLTAGEYIIMVISGYYVAKP